MNLEFIKFKVLVETQQERKIKVLRTDNGLEYCGQNFTEELDKNGIKRERTTAHTPQQNGVGERMNRTLTEMARCMLIQSKLPIHFWAEAISTAAYVRNRCPTKINEEVTSFEIWFGNKTNVAHLRPFGSKAFVLDKAPGKGKFQARSTECTMIGYSSESKAYRFWNDSARKIIKSRDVKFVTSFDTNDKKESIEFLNFDSEESNESEEEKEEEGEKEKDEDKEERRAKKEEEKAQESENEDTDGIRETPKVCVKIGPGRPSILRIGKRERPKKGEKTLFHKN